MAMTSLETIMPQFCGSGADSAQMRRLTDEEFAARFLTRPRGEKRQVTLEGIKAFLAKRNVDDMPIADMPADWLAKMMLRIATIGSIVQGSTKGILLMGCTGNGKTTRLKALAEFFKSEFAVAMDMVMDITHATFNGTVRDICNYPYFGNVSNPRQYDLVIDDLGIETPIVNNFGTKHDYMEEILRERHIALEKGALTHIATNLDMDGLRARYGERIYSRLQQMCVPIALPNEDRRRAR